MKEGKELLKDFKNKNNTGMGENLKDLIKEGKELIKEMKDAKQKKAAAEDESTETVSLFEYEEGKAQEYIDQLRDEIYSEQ